MAKQLLVQSFDDETVARIARILGPASAAQQALDELRQRRSCGENVSCYWDIKHEVLIVGPTINAA